MAEYETLQDIEDQHFTNCCQELTCNEKPTKIMRTIYGRKFKVNLFLCENHAIQFKRCLQQFRGEKDA